MQCIFNDSLLSESVFTTYSFKHFLRTFHFSVFIHLCFTLKLVHRVTELKTSTAKYLLLYVFMLLLFIFSYTCTPSDNRPTTKKAKFTHLQLIYLHLLTHNYHTCTYPLTTDIPTITHLKLTNTEKSASDKLALTHMQSTNLHLPTYN